jgi:hypothetical protein
MSASLNLTADEVKRQRGIQGVRSLEFLRMKSTSVRAEGFKGSDPLNNPLNSPGQNSMTAVL